MAEVTVHSETQGLQKPGRRFLISLYAAMLSTGLRAHDIATLLHFLCLMATFLIGFDYVKRWVMLKKRQVGEKPAIATLLAPLTQISLDVRQERHLRECEIRMLRDISRFLRRSDGILPNIRSREMPLLQGEFVWEESREEAGGQSELG